MAKCIKITNDKRCDQDTASFFSNYCQAHMEDTQQRQLQQQNQQQQQASKEQQ
jgi:hypothetical protein